MNWTGLENGDGFWDERIKRLYSSFKGLLAAEFEADIGIAIAEAQFA